MHSNAIHHQLPKRGPATKPDHPDHAPCESWGSSPPSVHARHLHSAPRCPLSPSPSLDLGLAPCTPCDALCLALLATCPPWRDPNCPSCSFFSYPTPPRPVSVASWPRGRLPALGEPAASVDRPERSARRRSPEYSVLLRSGQGHPAGVERDTRQPSIHSVPGARRRRSPTAA